MKRLLPLLLLILSLACSDDEVAPCEIQQLDISLTGTLNDLEGNPLPLSLAATYDAEVIPAASFEYLAQVLGHNAPTGSGSTAVFELTGDPGLGLSIQLAGSRIDGSNLGILGVMSAALLPGEAPAFSAIPRDALLVLFGTDDFIATGAEGDLMVTQVAPLEGTVHAELSDGAGRHRVVDGELVVTRTGPGC
ncbi:MAG TPA: hypothetical protein VJU17_08350 [Gemmatimonadales bacterium]|nr:hypothetical protein [Gemmatimonadales bacterium]